MLWLEKKRERINLLSTYLLFPLIYHVGEVEVLENIVNRMGMSSPIFVKCDCGMTEFLGTGDL